MGQVVRLHLHIVAIFCGLQDWPMDLLAPSHTQWHRPMLQISIMPCFDPWNNHIQEDNSMGSVQVNSHWFWFWSTVIQPHWTEHVPHWCYHLLYKKLYNLQKQICRKRHGGGKKRWTVFAELQNGRVWAQTAAGLISQSHHSSIVA